MRSKPAARWAGKHGDASIGERSRSFTPDTPWITGEQQLVVEPSLEDVAGNSPARVFDRDVSRPEDVPSQREAVKVRFSCAPTTS